MTFKIGQEVINIKDKNPRVYVVAGHFNGQVSYHPPENRGETYQKAESIIRPVDAKKY